MLFVLLTDLRQAMASRGRRARGPATQSDALFARIHDYGESSAVAVLLTEELGAVHAVAKGAKRVRNGFQGPIDRGVLYRVRLSKGGAGGLYHLNSSRVREPFARVRSDPARFLAAALVLEVAGDLMRENEPNRELFRLASFTLKALDRAPAERLPLAVTLFLARAVALSGHEPATSRCVRCGGAFAETSLVRLCPSAGGALHGRCARGLERGWTVGREALALLEDMLELPAADLLATEPPPRPLKQLRLLLASWLEHSLERGFRSLGPAERELAAARR